MTTKRYRSPLGMPDWRIGVIGLIITGLTVVGAIVMAVVGLVLTEWVLVVVGFGWCVTAVGLGVVFGLLTNRYDRAQALEYQGVRGVATVLEAAPTKVRTRNVGGRVYRVRLRVVAEGMAPYELEKGIVPQGGSSTTDPGKTWPVQVDRNDPTNIRVDWAQLLAARYTVPIGRKSFLHSDKPFDIRPTPQGLQVVLDDGRTFPIRGPQTGGPPSA